MLIMPETSTLNKLYLTPLGGTCSLRRRATANNFELALHTLSIYSTLDLA